MQGWRVRGVGGGGTGTPLQRHLMQGWRVKLVASSTTSQPARRPAPPALRYMPWMASNWSTSSPCRPRRSTGGAPPALPPPASEVPRSVGSDSLRRRHSMHSRRQGQGESQARAAPRQLQPGCTGPGQPCTAPAQLGSTTEHQGSKHHTARAGVHPTWPPARGRCSVLPLPARLPSGAAPWPPGGWHQCPRTPAAPGWGQAVGGMAFSAAAVAVCMLRPATSCLTPSDQLPDARRPAA